MDAFSAGIKMFGNIAKTQFKRTLVFQRMPDPTESQSDKRGFPTRTYTDVDPDFPIPCTYTIQGVRELTIAGKVRSVAPYKFTIPLVYEARDGQGVPYWKQVDFAVAYRAKVIATDSQPEKVVHIIAGGVDDASPANIFTAVELENVA